MQSAVLRRKQKHPTGFETLNTYLERDYGRFDSLFTYAYATQLLQARALQTAIEAHRLQEKCMGTLPWQFNDAWPGISWSVVDYYGRPKAGFYALKHLYAPILPVLQANGDSLEIVLSSHLLADSAATLLLELWQPGGRHRQGVRRVDIRLSAGRQNTSVQLPQRWQKRLKSGSHVLFVQVAGAATGRFLSPLPPKELHWPAAKVHVRKKGDAITIRSNRAVSQVYIDASSPLDLNFMDLPPRREITIVPLETYEKADFGGFAIWHQHVIGAKAR
jgi:beta-mannosidase